MGIVQAAAVMTVTNRFVLLCVAISCLVAACTAKFCPREKRDGIPQCRGKQGQFKCGIFYKNLYGDNEITWIGALPDSIKKVINNHSCYNRNIKYMPRVGSFFAINIRSQSRNE